MAPSRSDESCTRSVPQQGVLYLTSANDDTLAQLKALMSVLNLPAQQPHRGVLAVQLAAGALPRVAEEVHRHFTDADVRGIRCFVLADDRQPSPADFMQTDSLDALIDRVQADWLVEVLQSTRLHTFFQPIVRSRNPAEIVAYECLLRAKHADGSWIYPDRLFRAARSSGLFYHLDRMARLTAIETAAASGLSTDVFINFNPSSIYDPMHCLQSTVEAIDESGISPSRFVFEVVESEEIRDVDRLLRILDFYRAAGLRVALDDVGAGYSSLNLLARIKPDFIKIDMDLIRNVDCDPYKAQVASKLLEMARALLVATVVEGVETLGEWQWAVEHGADLAQGFLFARPEPWPTLAETIAPSGQPLAGVELPTTAPVVTTV